MIRSTFAVPALIGAMTLVGLVSGLAGDGAADILSWLTLALPPVTLAWAWRAKRC